MLANLGTPHHQGLPVDPLLCAFPQRGAETLSVRGARAKARRSFWPRFSLRLTPLLLCALLTPLTAAAQDLPELKKTGKLRVLAVAVSEGPQFMARAGALNEYLGNQRRTPTWNRLVVKYFGSAAPDILRRARE